MPILPPLPLQETATSTTTTVVGEQLHADCFEIALPYFDNAVCREILPLFHNVEVTPAEFAMRLHHAAPALMMRARLDKVQDMRELIIQLYKTRYYKKNSPEDSYFATTQRFFYPSEEVWRAFGDADAADAFMECEKHINCTFCGSDTVFKLRNNCGQYLDGEERELKLRPHRHDAMHHFLKRIIAEKLWCWQRLPESFM